MLMCLSQTSLIFIPFVSFIHVCHNISFHLALCCTNYMYMSLQGSFCGRIIMSCQLSPGVVALCTLLSFMFLVMFNSDSWYMIGTVVFTAGQFLYEDIVPVMCIILLYYTYYTRGLELEMGWCKLREG